MSALESSQVFRARPPLWFTLLALGCGAILIGGAALAGIAMYRASAASGDNHPTSLPEIPRLDEPLPASPRTASAGADDTGTDAASPQLAPNDHGFVDKRGGWGWGDRCWIHIKSNQLGWAKAECLQGMALGPASPSPKSSLLYNLGLIEMKTGNVAVAREYFQQSLALREHPDVRAALNSLE